MRWFNSEERPQKVGTHPQMNRATSGSAGCAEVPRLARAGVIMLFLSVKLRELSPAARLVRGVMGAPIAREVAQRGELGLAPLHGHVVCLQHSGGCVETSAASLEALGKKGNAV